MKKAFFLVGDTLFQIGWQVEIFYSCMTVKRAASLPLSAATSANLRWILHEKPALKVCILDKTLYFTKKMFLTKIQHFVCIGIRVWLCFVLLCRKLLWGCSKSAEAQSIHTKSAAQQGRTFEILSPHQQE